MATIRATILRGSGQVRTDGMTNIKIKITQGRDRAYISTDLYCYPDEFQNGFCADSWTNSRILDYMRQYTEKYLKLGDRVHDMTATEIKTAITTEKDVIEVDFLSYADEYLEWLKQSGKTGSLRSAKWVVHHLKTYRTLINFSDIDSAFLMQFEKYMKRQGVGNAVSTYMARLRVIFNKGREKYNDEDRGIIQITNYPFKRYKIQQPKHNANDSALSIDQLKRLMNFPCRYRREQQAVDVVKIMLCLMSPNTKDLYKMPKADKKGRVIYSRSKTGRKFSVRVEPELLPMIEKYRSKERMFCFADEYYDDQAFQKAVNIGLQSICDAIHEKAKSENVEIDFPEKITSNWIRHTWATIARNDCGISKDDVALCLGHQDADNRVTDMYIKYNYSIQDNANRTVLDYIFKTQKEKKPSFQFDCSSN